MKKRIFAGITASILALSCAAQVPAILSASAAGNYEMQLNIKLNGEKKAISPYIYGVNEAGNSTSLKKSDNAFAAAGRQSFYWLQLGK